MNIYIVIRKGIPVSTHWTHQDAEERTHDNECEGFDCYIYTVTLDPLHDLVMQYYDFREYKRPNLLEAFLFLVSEIGELADALVQGIKVKWVRNNPQNKTVDPAPEVGDVLMMLTVLAGCLTVDPLEAMLEKFKTKGFKQ